MAAFLVRAVNSYGLERLRALASLAACVGVASQSNAAQARTPALPGRSSLRLTLRFQMGIKPTEHSVVPKLRVLRLQHPVTFVRINQELRLDALPLKRG